MQRMRRLFVSIAKIEKPNRRVTITVRFVSLELFPELCWRETSHVRGRQKCQHIFRVRKSYL